MAQGSILVVDDEPGLLDVLEWELGSLGYQVRAAPSGTKAVQLLKESEFDAVISDVRMPGLEDRSPRRALLTRGEAVDGWEVLDSPEDVYRLHDVNDLLVEGGSVTATAFLSTDVVDRILIYRAPIIVGEGKSSFGYVGLDAIADAHGRWRLVDEQRLGVDRLEVYERVQAS